MLAYHGDMKTYRWNETKNERLKRSRGISFEDIVLALDAGGLLELVDHPNSKRYPNQKVFVIALAEYVYLVPHVEEVEYVFLKTIIPIRRGK